MISYNPTDPQTQEIKLKKDQISPTMMSYLRKVLKFCFFAKRPELGADVPITRP